MHCRLLLPVTCCSLLLVLLTRVSVSSIEPKKQAEMERLALVEDSDWEISACDIVFWAMNTLKLDVANTVLDKFPRQGQSAYDPTVKKRYLNTSERSHPFIIPRTAAEKASIAISRSKKVDGHVEEPDDSKSDQPTDSYVEIFPNSCDLYSE